ncbi:unnamed protein product [Mytilus edulis]|uniref:Uncharacterized protein n=1 Tax=Mytilus edulis TaxID=6550 RepID=A0A8S3T0C6_MYTED|nr:unnamed protein product [Mytilus edulis]
MSTRRKSASRVQTETLNDQNPSNWTASQLKAVLGKIGIKITGHLSNSSFERLYLDNLCNDNSSTGIDKSDYSAERSSVSDGSYSLNLSAATVCDSIDMNTSDHSIPTVQQEITTHSISYAHATKELPPNALSAHATTHNLINNNQNVNMKTLSVNAIQLCQQSMQQMNK